jgi:hypothetical protein
MLHFLFCFSYYLLKTEDYLNTLLDCIIIMARIREDVAKKKQQRKQNDHRVVKSYLSSIIINHENNKDIKCKIIEAINNRVLAYSKRQVIASIALNYLIKELFDNVALDDIKDVTIPDILNITFGRQLLLGTGNANLPFVEIQELYQRHPYLLQKINEQTNYEGVRNVYSAGATKFLTNVHNHLWTNFKKRMYMFINEHVDKDSRSAVLYHLMNWEMDSDKTQKLQSLDVQLLLLIKIQKDILGNSNIDEKWCKNKSNFNNLLRYSVFVSRVVPEKQFNIVPISKTKKHYITIDTSTLYGILTELKLFGGNSTTFESLRDEHWKSIINFKKLQGKDFNFTHTIDTDGTAISVHFERPKKNKEKSTMVTINHSTTDYWGCDPGRTNILYLVKKNEDGNHETLKLSRKQYYKESGIVKAIRHSNKWQNIKELQDANLSSFSSKGCDLKTFNMFVRNYLEHWTSLWKEYSSEKWSIQKMRLYGGKKRVFANFFNKMSKNTTKDIVVGYGSAKFNPTGKNEVAVPTSRAFKECSNRFKTIPIDEFRTSKIYYEDEATILQTVIQEDKNRVIRGLLWYSSTIESENKFVNRDLNAAINILNCLVKSKRAKMLSRNKENTKIIQRVGKTILC